jgi:hypothetical protein
MSETPVAITSMPSTYVHKWLPDTVAPYQRVIGLDTGDQSVSLKHAPTMQAETEILNLPQHMADNLTAFALHHLTDFDPEEPQFDAFTNPNMYQCYTFAQWIHGNRVDGEEAKERIGELGCTAERSSLRYGLDTGEHGLLVSSITGQLLHSMIGLGDGRTIQAMNTNGNLGISPQKDVNTYYTTRGYKPWLYVVGQLPPSQDTTAELTAISR